MNNAQITKTFLKGLKLLGIKEYILRMPNGDVKYQIDHSVSAGWAGKGEEVFQDMINNPQLSKTHCVCDITVELHDDTMENSDGQADGTYAPRSRDTCTIKLNVNTRWGVEYVIHHELRHLWQEQTGAKFDSHDKPHAERSHEIDAKHWGHNVVGSALMNKKVPFLRNMAYNMEIKGYSKMKKIELVEAIENCWV